MKFKVCIEEHLSQEFEVEADDIENAERIAREQYYDCEFVVNCENVTDRLMAVAEVNEEYPEFCEF